MRSPLTATSKSMHTATNDQNSHKQIHKSLKRWEKWKWLTRVRLFVTPWDYTVLWILQARIREWVAAPFSRDQTQVSCIADGLSHQLSHHGSPGILEWVVYPFASGSSRPRNWTRVSCIAGIFFTSWATREALKGGGWCLKKKRICIILSRNIIHSLII